MYVNVVEAKRLLPSLIDKPTEDAEAEEGQMTEIIRVVPTIAGDTTLATALPKDTETPT